jgi:hypothetical protein
MLLALSKDPEMFPSLDVTKVMLPCINSTGHRIVGCNDRKRFGRNLPILPFNQQIEP